MTIRKSALSKNTWMVFQFGEFVFRGTYDECQDYAAMSVVERGKKVGAFVLIE